MSSIETSGAPAEAAATTQPAEVPAAAASFGSTRGSGLARGKRPSSSPAHAASAASSEYKPTAIAVVSAPREYQNPFAPTPAPAEPVVSIEPSAVVAPAPAEIPAPPENPAPAPAAVEETTAKAELNILPPEQQKTVPHETWESNGFRPEREARSERPRREDRPSRESLENAPIPEKFLYVRPGHTFVPTPPSFYGGGPREPRGQYQSQSQASSPAPSAPAQSAPAPAKNGGFFGWVKSLFGGKTEAHSAPVAAPSGEGQGQFDRGQRHRRRRRGGRGHGGDQAYSGGSRPEGREGGHRRRGGRGRGQDSGPSEN